MPHLVIGLVGKKRAGKGTFSDFLTDALRQECSVHQVTFSDPLVETLDVWQSLDSHSRENLQNVSIAFDSTFGTGVLAQEIKTRIESLSARVVIADGLRWLQDLKMLKNFPNHYLIEIHADAKVRHERVNAEKGDEAQISLEEFVKNEKEKKTEQYIDEIARHASEVVYNNGNNLDALRYAADKSASFLKSLSKV